MKRIDDAAEALTGRFKLSGERYSAGITATICRSTMSVALPRMSFAVPKLNWTPLSSVTTVKRQ
jgi:hypothetical protein